MLWLVFHSCSDSRVSLASDETMALLMQSDIGWHNMVASFLLANLCQFCAEFPRCYVLRARIGHVHLLRNPSLDEHGDALSGIKFRSRSGVWDGIRTN